MGAQRGPPGADLSGGPRVGSRQGNWEGRDGALQCGRGPSTALGRGGAAAGSGSAGGPGAVGPTSNTPSYAGAVVVGRGSVGPWGDARRGSAATGPGVPPGRRSTATPSGRGAGRGVTVAQTPAQLASAAAQRDARKAGQTRVAAGGDRHRMRGGSSMKCIIPGCHFASGGAHKRHAVCAHLPQLFGEISGSTNLSNRQMARLLELVQFMASTAIGCTVEALTVGALQRYWRRAGLQAHPVLPTATPLIRRLEAFAGWESPADYSASPPNSIALLLQWNVALSLMGTMGRRQRERCRMWQSSSLAPVQATDTAPPVTEVPVTAVAPSLASASAETPVSVEVTAPVGTPASTEAGPSGVGRGGEAGWQEATGKKKRKKRKGGKKPQEAVALADLKSELSAISIGDSQAQGQVRGEEVMEGVVEGDGGDGSKGVAFPGGREKGAAPQPSPASPSVGPGFDAHFHLDRLKGKEKGKLSVDFIYKMNVSPRDKVDLKGGCMVFCDPEHYPSAEDLRRIREHPGFRVAVGIHPKHAGKVGDAQVRQLKQLVANPGVAAMGEIGLDFTAGSLAPVPQQERLFGECLTVAPRNKPIVLHIRPASADPEVIRQAYHRACMVMKGVIGSRQVIQLHSFTGGADVVRGWLAEFPNTYFSFSGLAAGFSDYQKQGLKAVQVGKMLLETDSPHLVVRDADTRGAVTHNSPLYLGAVAKLVATIRGESPEDVLEVTYHNARTFLQLLLR